PRHSTRARRAARSRGPPATAGSPAPPPLRPVIPPGLPRPARPLGGLRRGATRLRSSCRFSFHPGSRGRPVRWVACDEGRPGSVPHAASHSTRAREAGPFGGRPATRGDAAPFLVPLLIPPGLARPARSVGGLRRGATRLRSSCRFSFHPGSRGRPVRWAAPPTHDRPQLDGVRVADDLVGRDQLVATDHEDRLREDVELTQDLLHATPTHYLDLTPGVSENDLHRRASPVTPSETRARA